MVVRTPQPSLNSCNEYGVTNTELAGGQEPAGEQPDVQTKSPQGGAQVAASPGPPRAETQDDEIMDGEISDDAFDAMVANSQLQEGS